uniref:Uncharacterized protein n=1 Tax=Populus alba TaxID=43335 RepID=A0A4U5R131_POPAL|nr:hypothetical protein D5086_0000015310 [Populus alba]
MGSTCHDLKLGQGTIDTRRASATAYHASCRGAYHGDNPRRLDSAGQHPHHVLRSQGYGAGRKWRRVPGASPAWKVARPGALGPLELGQLGQLGSVTAGSVLVHRTVGLLPLPITLSPRPWGPYGEAGFLCYVPTSVEFECEVVPLRRVPPRGRGANLAAALCSIRGDSR